MNPKILSVQEPEGPGVGATSAGRLAGLVVSARPRQWVKNVACFAGLVFSGRLFDASAMSGSATAFAGFCLASSSVYLINDVCDRRSDAANPKKRSRPIAAGLVPVGRAIAAAVVLAVAAMGSTLFLPAACRGILAAYLTIGLAYSVRLKHSVLIDVMIIALGFVLRILHGVYAVGVAPTPWIVLCMFFLALFLGFAKRRSELNQIEVAGVTQRPVLRKYRTDLLDQLLVMTATMTITCYSLYTVTGRPGNETLVVTVPLVVYGVCRYLLLVMIFDVGEAPDKDLLDDTLLIVNGLLWVVLCVAIIYFNVNFIHFHQAVPAPVR
jgi:4-hydroxybenzoate polyprenyltransferase